MEKTTCKYPYITKDLLDNPLLSEEQRKFARRVIKNREKSRRYYQKRKHRKKEDVDDSIQKLVLQMEKERLSNEV